jgi:hypothetical protein
MTIGGDDADPQRLRSSNFAVLGWRALIMRMWNC